MQQRGIRPPLIVRKEGDVGDAGEPLERAPHLASCVDAERAGAHAVHHDAHRGLPDDAAQLGVIAQEACDAERVG